jgi:hypothetical protein
LPEISRFEGITIDVNYKDDEQHHMPHIHVNYAEFSASVALDGTILEIDKGFPNKKLTLVAAWMQLHQEELYKAWNMAVQGKKPMKIKPLR